MPLVHPAGAFSISKGVVALPNAGIQKSSMLFTLLYLAVQVVYLRTW